MSTKPVHGMFDGGIAYSRYGGGPKSLLFVPGGPGNGLPSGTLEWMIRRMFRPYVATGYSVWNVTRRQDMPPDHTIEAMADDYAQLIRDELEGRVDVFPPHLSWWHDRPSRRRQLSRKLRSLRVRRGRLPCQRAGPGAQLSVRGPLGECWMKSPRRAARRSLARVRFP